MEPLLAEERYGILFLTHIRYRDCCTMTPKTHSFATVVALTSCGAALTQGDVQSEDSRSSFLRIHRRKVKVVGDASAGNKAVLKSNQTFAESPTQRDLIPRTTDSNNAPGCGPSSGCYHSIYLGCYHDRQDDRAFPFEVPLKGQGALDCERLCSNRGYRYFGRQFKGQCFCGSDYDQIVKYGTDYGCNCCGENVGGGKMCVWENTKHPDSQAEAPVVAPVLPRPATAMAPAPMPHSYLFASGTHVGSLSLSSGNIFDEEASAFIPKPTKPFRLRLFWEQGYNWQDSTSERFWCAECAENCSSGSHLQIGKCSEIEKQQWLANGLTIRFAPNPSLCVTSSGFGINNPLRLHHCNGGNDQNFYEVKENARFELQPASLLGDRCVSQQHHPKDGEILYPEMCSKTRSTDTSYWQVY
jgi:hypothetical protein